MPPLRVDLQDGFDGDEVIVTLDGVTVYHGEDVRTRHQIGLAEVVEAAADEGRHALEIRLPRRDLVWERVIDVRGETHIGVSLPASGALQVAKQCAPFRYA